MMNEANTAPLTDEERVQLTQRSALDFPPLESAGDLKDALSAARIKEHGNMLILARGVLGFAKSDLIDKFAKLDADQFEDQVPADAKMIHGLQAAKEFYDTASVVVGTALARMTVVNAALVLRESEEDASC